MKCTYETHFNLTNPVKDFDAAQEYLQEDDMTGYLVDDIKYDGEKGRCDIDPSVIESIEWELTDDDEGYITLITKAELSPEQLEYVSRWVSGQNSDGLGEGFEQQGFAEVYDESEDEEDELYGEPVDMASFDWETNDYPFKLKNKTNEEKTFIEQIIDAGSTACVRSLLESKLHENALFKFDCKDCQKAKYGEWKSDVPTSIQACPGKLVFKFWNTNADDVDDVLKKWAADNKLKVKAISNKVETPVDGGNVWLSVDLEVDE